MSAPTITPRTEPVVLLQGDDEAELRRLREEAKKLRQVADDAAKKVRRLKSTQRDGGGSRLLSDTDPYGQALEEEKEAVAAAEAAEQAADEFADEAEGRGVTVVIRSIPRKKWHKVFQKVAKEHPPAEDDQQSQQFGADMDAFAEALVPVCMLSPVMSDEEKEEFLDSLSVGQFDRLATVAGALNRTLGANPKAKLSSGRTRA